ncbi:MAG: YciI family protein [Janthinobacterium lividum]
MKNYLVLFRETDARTQVPAPETARAHQQHWQQWLATHAAAIKGGRPLTLRGRQLAPGQVATEGPRFHGQEFVGGFLLLEAPDLDAATRLIANCPIFEADGLAEVREMM